MPAEITLKLPPEFVAMCETDGVPPDIVLKNFIADLCELDGKGGYQHHGADYVVGLAKRYYHASGYPYYGEDGFIIGESIG